MRTSRANPWLWLATVAAAVLPIVAAADQSDPQSGVVGTDAADAIVVVEPLTVSASLETQQGERLDASATGIDALAGDDTVSVTATVDVDATASASLASDPEETEAKATTAAVKADDGDDVVAVEAALTATSTAFALYGNELDIQQEESDTAQKISVSMQAVTEAAAIDTGDGDDRVENESLVSALAASVSGGSADALNATIRKSVSLETKSVAESTASGVATGAGDDAVVNSGVLAATALSTSGALALALVADQTESAPPPEGQPPVAPKKTQMSLDASATAAANATAITTTSEDIVDSSEDTSPFGLDGLKVTYFKTLTADAGADSVVNEAIVSAIATALSGAGAGGIANRVNGSVESKATSEATASALGIATGGGADTVTNSALVDAIAIAIAEAVSVSLEIGKPSAPGESTSEPPDRNNKTSSTTSATAKATAMGIDAEGEAHDTTIDRSAEIEDGALRIAFSTVTESLAADDRVDNRAALVAFADASSGATAASATIQSGGSVASESSSTAEATSTGIHAGGGADVITNDAALTSTANAAARARSLSLGVGSGAETPSGSTPSTPVGIGATSENTTKATASAMGIDAEGAAHATTSTREVIIDRAGSITVTVAETRTALGGDDEVLNSGVFLVGANATSNALDASIDVNAVGSLEAKASAEASATATGVATGGGSDRIDNTGWLTVNAAADAKALALALVVKQPASESTEGDVTPDDTTPPKTAKPEKSNASVDASATASATASGVDAEGEAHETSRTTTVELTRESLTLTHATTRAALAGDDVVGNTGVIDVDASATSGTLAAGLVIGVEGSAAVNADSKATARAHGVATGGGADEITNEGALTTTATADATALAVSLSVRQPEQSETPDDPGYLERLKERFATADAKANAVAEAISTGIDAEGDAHATASTSTVTIDGSGLRIARKVESSSLAGNDVVTNSAVLWAASTATSGAGAVVVQIETQGTAASESNASATAHTTGIATGGGDDVVTNSGALIANATSGAGALSVSFAQQDKPGAPAKSEAKATSESVAIGIDADGTSSLQQSSMELAISSEGVAFDFARSRTGAVGADVVVNDGVITVNALAGSGAGSGAISIDGAASAEVQSRAGATATGVITGGGDDRIDNTGALATTATSAAGVLAVAFGQNSSEGAKTRLKVAVDAKAEATATAMGVVADGGVGTEETEGGLRISGEELEIGYVQSLAAATGRDEIDNAGALVSVATAIAESAGGAAAIDGGAKVDVTSRATAVAGGIDAGGDADSITNTGAIAAVATATSHALSVGFGQKTEEKAKVKVDVEASAIADATAVGIRADSGVDRTTTIDVRIDGDLQASLAVEELASAGDDVVVNAGVLTATSTAVSGALGAAVAIDGVAKANIDSTATSRATGIETGGGADLVQNTGAVLVTATAAADAVAAAVGAKSSDTGSARTKVDADSKAIATATGVGTDDGERDRTRSATLEITDSGLALELQDTRQAQASDDTLVNSGAIAAVATAVSGAQAVALSIKGAAYADAGSESKASASALDAGGGADHVVNTGELAAVATAAATTLTASISTEGRAIANSGLLFGGTKAEARAVGVSAAGDTRDESTTITTTIDFDDIGVATTFLSVKDGLVDGDDVIENSGAISVLGTAIATQFDAGITSKGVAVAVGRAEAKTYAAAIDGGHGDDRITNTGTLDVGAIATAAIGNVAVTGKGLAVAGNSAWDGGTKAEATAVGIAGDSGERVTTSVEADADASRAQLVFEMRTESGAGDDVIENHGDVTTLAVAVAPSLAVAVSTSGVSAAVSTSTAKANATALKGGHGDDAITNSGVLSSTADATAATANVALTNSGVAAAADAVWNGGTTAAAVATGIAGDDGARVKLTRIAVGTQETSVVFDDVIALAAGADTIVNDGAITADATARALSLAVGVVGTQGVGVATATSTADARASAIDAGGGNDVDDVVNTGDLRATATAIARAASVSVTNTGAALSFDSVWDGGTQATARARGIDVGGGGEVIDNRASIDAVADASTVSVATAVTISGVAGASATSTSVADAVAIDAAPGFDSDTVVNDGALSATARSSASSASIALTNAGLAIAAGAVWDGGTGADARARGIDVGEGIDAVVNTGSIDARAEALAAEAAVSVAVSGVAGATATSTAIANAGAIDAGGGDDSIENAAALSAAAQAIAFTSTVSVTGAGVALAADAVWDGGTMAEAKARGIDAGAGADVLDNSGTIDVTADGHAFSAAVSVAVSGVAGGVAKSTVKTDAAAIDAGEGADDVINSGALSAEAFANAASAAVSFTAAGVAGAGGSAWDGGTTGEAKARAIDLGAGDDALVNSGDLTADATAHATGISVAVAVEGVAGAVSAATARADAASIAAGDGNDVVTNTGELHAAALANANTVSAAGTKFGVSVAGNNSWDGGTRGEARAAGIRGEGGSDTIDNGGDIVSEATVVAPSVAVAFTVAGVAAAVSTASADAEATAIDGGDGADRLDNRAALDVRADAKAVAVNVAIAGVGAAVAADAVWDGGTTAVARGRGLDGGDGDDAIGNEIDGAIAVAAIAEADSSSTSITAGGFAGSVSTSTANADARGIDGGAGADVARNDGGIDSVANATARSVSISVTASGGALASDSFWDGGTTANAFAAGTTSGAGDDQFLNTGAIDARAASSTLSVALAGTINSGLAGAVVASTSTAGAIGMAANAGDDVSENRGTIAATSFAQAEGVSVAFSGAGGAIAGAGVDAATRANAASTGMTGDDGDDTLLNRVDASIHLASTARTRETAVALTLAGMAAAESSALATARGAGLDGGDGADVLHNLGAITGSVDATSVARSIALTAFGQGLATANAAGDAGVTGLMGGSGDDALENVGTIGLAATARATGQSFGAGMAGVAFSEANAEGLARAVGLDGGDGADALRNLGAIALEATALTTARSVSATQSGYAVGQANSTADAAAHGVQGGAGDDLIVNATGAVVGVVATADAVATGVAITVAGAASGEAYTRPNVFATGLAGDAGSDGILNDGSVTVSGRAKSFASGASVSVAGLASARAGTEVDARLVGLSGGDGSDTIVNRGTVDVGAPAGEAWMATLDVRASSFGFAGGAAADSAATARTTSIGVDGGDGADEIANDGRVSVVASALNHSASSTLSIFGAGAAAGESGAFTHAIGLSGAAAEDRIDNSGDVDVTARSRLELAASSYSFAGSGTAGGTLAAVTEADGVHGGDAADRLWNAGHIRVDARSELASTGKSEATFGGSSGTTTSGGRTRAAGMHGDDGDDWLMNASAGLIEVDASTDVATQAIAYTFGGGSGNAAVLSGVTQALGMAGGSGADALFNHGAVSVDARARLTASGGAETSIGGSKSTGRSSAQVSAAGLDGGDGADWIENTGAVRVDALAIAEARNTAAAVIFTGDAETGAFTRAESEAIGLSAGSGGNDIRQGGMLEVTAESVGYGFSYASGANLSFSGDAVARVGSVAESRAIGIGAGHDGNVVVNTGAVTVTALATTAKDLTTTVTVYNPPTDADGSVVNRTAIDAAALPALSDAAESLADYPTGTTWFWRQAPEEEDDPYVSAPGAYYQVAIVTVEADDPDTTDVVETVDVRRWTRVLGELEENTIVANSLPSYASANGNGLDGDGNAVASGSARAQAAGVELGDGDDAVTNSNVISVSARAEAVFTTAADGDAFGNALGTSDGTAVAAAWGVVLGGGDNTFTNTGEVIVLATPAAQAWTDVSGGDICITFFFWTWCGGGGKGYGTAIANFEASAVGVVAGGGDDVIVNDGVIRVVAAPEVRVDPRRGAFVAAVPHGEERTATVSATATVVGVETGAGDDAVVNRGTIEAEAHALPGFASALAAVGVRTGDGDDRLDNFGTISALTFTGGVATARIGVDMGAGNDVLHLTDGSVVVGSVDLGEGDDTLVLRGNPVVRDAAGNALVPQAGPGSDTLVLDGAGAFATTPESIEHARKTGLGTYTLPALDPLETLVIDQGVLALGADYTFADFGDFSTYFHVDGDRGQLAVAGEAALAGAVDVTRRGDGYVEDGSRYRIVATTTGVGGDFAEVALPAAAPLLRFDLERSAVNVDVVATAASFATVAESPLHRQIARDLDVVAPGATGDFDSVLGTLQTMTGDFDAAFATLSPDAHFAGDRAVRDASVQIRRLLQQHLTTTRSVYRDRLAAHAAYGDVSLAFSQQGFAAIGFSSNPALGLWDEGRIQRNLSPIAHAAPAAGGGRRSDATAQSWALGALSQGDWDAVDGYSAVDTDSSAIAIGRDYRLRDDLVLGVSLGRTDADADLDDIGATTSVDGWYGSLYGTWFDDRAHVEGGLSYAKHSFDTTRTVTVGPIARLAQSDYDGSSWMAFLGAGYEFTWSNRYAEPFATLHYYSGSLDDFVEIGADSLDQIADDRDPRALLGDAGVRVGIVQKLARGAIDWYALAALHYDFEIETDEIRFAWAGAPGTTFTLDARDVAAESTLFGAGVSYVGRRSALALDYRGVFNSDYDDQALGLRLTFAF
jgi:uncharacterized protein YhjY with autotransporter beta-barrel domain